MTDPGELQFCRSNPLTAYRLILAGILLRLLLMPFSLHFDFFPIENVTNNLARFGKAAFDTRVIGFYFPPMAYLVKLPFHWLALLFSPQISAWLELSKGFMYLAQSHESWIAVLLDADGGLALFRNIFLLKLGLLACDLAIAALLFRLSGRWGQRSLVMLLWAINPVVLHSVFAHGGIDIIPALFVTAALAAAVSQKKHLTILFIMLGVFSKVSPVLLLVPYILAAEHSFSGRLRLAAFTLGLTLALYYLLFVLPGVDIRAIAAGPGEMMVDVKATVVNLLKKAGLVSSYLLFLVYLYLRKKRNEKLVDHLEIFLVPFFILFAFNPAGFRYWVWISPPAILYFALRKEIRPLMVLNLLSLIASRILPQQSLQLGIFSPLCPEYFLSFPSFTAITSRIVSEFWLVRTVNLVFMGSSLALALYICRFSEVFRERFRPLIERTGRYALTALAVGLIGIFAIGIGTGPGKSPERAGYIWLGGFRETPDSTLLLSPGDSLLSEVIDWRHLGFNAVGLWLEGDSSKNWLRVEVQQPGAGTWAVRRTLEGDAKGESIFDPRIGETFLRTDTRLTVENLNTGENKIRVGLIKKSGTRRLRFSKLYGSWMEPYRDPEGKVRLREPNNEPFDLARSTAGLPSGWQLSVNLYRKAPENLAAAWRRIGSRIMADRPFLWAYLGILTLLSSALVGTVFFRPSRKL